MFGVFSSPTDRVSKGREAIMFFHNQNMKYVGYDLKIEELIDKLASNGRNIPLEKISGLSHNFLDTMGMTIENIQASGFLTGDHVQASMETLADNSQGKIPNQAWFFKALSDEAQNPTFIETFSAVSQGTAIELGKGAQAIGVGVIDAGKTLVGSLPMIVMVVVAGGLFLVYGKAKRSLG